MADEERNRMATNVFKGQLARADVTYEELIRRVKEHGTDASYKGIYTNVNRSTFSFTFLMQCMTVLGKAEMCI